MACQQNNWTKNSQFYLEIMKEITRKGRERLLGMKDWNNRDMQVFMQAF